jgi:uncharacterized membrane protein
MQRGANIALPSNSDGSMSATQPLAPVPSSREFTFVGICYGLYVFGLFLAWPALLGVIVAYVKRGDVEGSMLESHYRWLINTFWVWTILWVLILSAMLAVVIPNALTIAQVARAGDYLAIPWEMIAAAVVGGLALAIVWFWVVTRLFRGTLRLADGRTIP